MMNRWVMFWGLICFTSCGWAKESEAYKYKASCTKLNIVLENKTNTTCVLQQKTLAEGIVLSSENLIQIPSQASGTIRLLDRLTRGVTLSLTYRCGEGLITIRNSKVACILGGELSADIISIANMNANNKTTMGSIVHPAMGEIVWVFS